MKNPPRLTEKSVEQIESELRTHPTALREIACLVFAVRSIWNSVLCVREHLIYGVDRVTALFEFFRR